MMENDAIGPDAAQVDPDPPRATAISSGRPDGAEAASEGTARIVPAVSAAMRNGRLHRDTLLRSASGALLGMGAPRLPAPPLLAFDEVWDLATTGGPYGLGGARARADLARLDWAFRCHFVGDPVMPGAMMLDALFQLVGLYGTVRGFTGQGRATRVQEVRFLAAVTPSSESLEYRISVRLMSASRQIVIADGEAISGGRICLTASRLVVICKSKSMT